MKFSVKSLSQVIIGFFWVFFGFFLKFQWA